MMEAVPVSVCFFIRLFNDASMSKMIMRVSVRSLYLAYIGIIGCLLVSVAQPSAGVSKIYTVRHKRSLSKNLYYLIKNQTMSMKFVKFISK